MNTFNIDYKFLLDTDNNPIIVFNHSGKILYLNDNAEVLLGYVNAREIFNLAINNAPKSYGSKTSQIELNYNQLKFYAINVSYNSDEWIAIRLYYRPRDTKAFKKLHSKNEVLTDINTLLDIAISQFKIESNATIKLFTDQDIPKVLLNQNNFSKLLRKTLSSFKASSYLDISLKLDIGEHIVINGQKYSLVNLTFASNGRYTNEDNNIKELANELFLLSTLLENSISFEIPLITK